MISFPSEVSQLFDDLANIATIIQLVIWAIITIAGGALAIGYVTKMRPIWKRFTKNIKRQVAVISTEEQDMTPEKELLEGIGYFKRVKLLPPSTKSIDLIDGSAIVVIGYTENSPTYKKAFEYAKNHRLPFVVYSGSNWLSKTDKDELKGYMYGSLCESDMRLVSDVFNIVSTNPAQK